MSEHKCPNCGHIFSGGICCSKCGSVFLFEDEYENKTEAEKTNEKRIEKENYDLANEIVSSIPQNDFEAKRREIIEELLKQKEARALEKKRQQEELQRRIEREEEERRLKAEEEARRKAREEEEARLKAIEEARAEEERKRAEEEAEKERIALEERYAAILKAEQEKKNLENDIEEVSNEEIDVETEINFKDEADENICENVSTDSFVEDNAFKEENSIEALNGEENNFEATKIFKRDELFSPKDEHLKEGIPTDEETLENKEETEFFEDENDELLIGNEYDIENDEEAEEFVEMEETEEAEQPHYQEIENEIKTYPAPSYDKFLNVLRYIMVGLYSLTILFMVLPFSEIMNMTTGSRMSITNVYFAIPVVCGLIIAIFEKNFIRKYIVGITLSLAYLLLYIYITRPLIPVNYKDIIYFVMFGLTFVLSFTGVIVDRSTMRQKMAVWFDFIVYLILIFNVFVFVFMCAIWILTPGFVNGLVKVNFYGLYAIIILSIISCVIMLRHKNWGADLFLLGGICLILMLISSYDQMMDFVGYGIGNDYMHLVGKLCAVFMISSVVFPIVIFVWQRFISYKKDGEV